MSDVHTILIICCVFALLFVLIICLLSVVLFADEQPDSNLPWAFSSRMFEMYKLIRKFLLSFSLLITRPYPSIGGIIVFSLIVFTMLSLYELYQQAYMNNKRVFYALLTTEGTIIWISLITLLQIIAGVNWSNPIILAIFVVILIVVVYLLNGQQYEDILLNSSIPNFKESEGVETYCRILLENVIGGSKHKKVPIEGIIAIHSMTCNKPHCVCKKLTTMIEEQGEQDETSSLDQKKDINKSISPRRGGKESMKGIPDVRSIIEVESTEHKKQKLNIYKLLIDEVTGWNDKQEKKVRLHIYLAYLKLFCFENQLASLYELMCAEESSPSIYEEFLMFRLKNRIEVQIKRRESVQQSSNDIDNLIMFQQILAEIQENMQETLKLFIGFWKELQDESPNFQYLGNMSHEITALAGKIRASYKQLIAINSNNIYCRMLYALFLKKIIKDEFEANDVYEEINLASNNNRLRHSYTTEDKYGANSKTALFIISGEKDNVGEVLCINNEVSELLGYEKSEIIAHNISKIMPPMIASKHSQMIFNFFGSGRYASETDRVVFPLHKLGYILPCANLHRVVPRLTHGLQLIGFLNKIADFSEHCSLLERNMSPDDVVILLTDENWVLQAFNIRASRLFGVNPSLANLKKYILSEEKISLIKFIPKLEDRTFHPLIKSPLGSETLFNLASIHKTLEAEVEIISPDHQSKQSLVEEAASSTSLQKVYDETSTHITDGNIKGQITYMDLIYGKYQKDKEPEVKMKLVMALVDQPLEKETVKVTEQDLETIKQRSKKKDDFLMDDNISQSQSSNSSNASSATDQKNVRNFKEKIKEQQNPFFVRCFVKLGVLIFLLILSSASIYFTLIVVLEYVLTNVFIQFLDDSYDSADIIYGRLDDMLNIPNSFRTIYQVYKAYESGSSEIYSDRVASYANFISDHIEGLRSKSNAIATMKHPYSQTHRQILEKSIIQFAEKADSSALNNQEYYTNYTMSVAITKYVAKGTELKQYSNTFLKSGVKTNTTDDSQNLDRLMYFMIENGKGTLRYYMLKAQEYFFGEVNDEIASKGRVITITLVVDPIVIILLMVMFIPFILKVQSSLLKIYLHLCQFKDCDINNWLEVCNNSAADIKASISQIRKNYMSESFDIKLQEAGNSQVKVKEEQKKNDKDKEKEKATEAEKDKETEGNGTQQTTTLYTTKKLNQKGEEEKRLTEEEADQLLKSKDQAIAERKQKLFSRITQEKTKTYLIYLFFFAIYIGVFRTADGFVFSSLYSDTDIRMYLYQIMSNRSESSLLSMFYLREELISNKVLQDYNSSVNPVSYYVDQAFDAEMATSRVRAKLTGDLTSLRNYLNSIDTSDYCSTIFKSQQDITKCSTIYRGQLPIGYNSVLINALSYVKKTNGVFESFYRTNLSYAQQELKNVEIIKINDIRTEYAELTFNNIFNVYKFILDDWISQQLLIHNLKFSLYIIFLLVIFVILWRKMVTNMQMDIVKALGILNILPTTHLGSNPDFIREMSKSNLIN